MLPISILHEMSDYLKRNNKSYSKISKIFEADIK